MQSIQCINYGSTASEAVKSNLIRKPTKNELKPLEILVEVLACGCDFVQLLLMQNKYQLKQKPPFTLGGEACGRIIALGTDVKGLEMGDMVIGAGNGMFCEYKILNSLGVLKLDRDIDPIYAPSPYSYVTSLHALKYRAKLKAGETLLVLGASGGVGSTAIQIGKILGATVIACASTEAKLSVCKNLGADHLINYDSENLKLKVRELTNGKGADVVYDPVGDKYCEPAVRALAFRGRLIVIGFAAGEIPRIPINLLLLKEASILGSALAESQRVYPEQTQAERQEVLDMFRDGKYKPLVTNVLPFKSAIEGFDMFQNRKVTGKLMFVTPKYEEEYGISKNFTASSSASSNSRMNDFVNGKVFPNHTPFWVMTLVKFKSNELAAAYNAYFDNQESVVRNAGGKTIFKAFDYVRTVVNGGGLVPEWDGVSIVEFPSIDAFKTWSGDSSHRSHTEFTDVYEVHAFDGFWIDPSKGKRTPLMENAQVETDIDFAEATHLAEEKAKNKQLMQQIGGSPGPFIKYIQDNKFSEGRIWKLNLLKLEDNSFYAQYGKRASGVITSGKVPGHEGGSGGLKFSSGRHVYTLVGDVHYDQIATMQYPSRNAFVAFANSQGSQQKGQLSEEAKKAGKLRKDLRTAGLAVQALIAIQPDKADAIRDPNAPNYSRI